MTCTRDHPWGGRTWLEFEITCDACHREYALVPQADHVVLVRRADVEAQERLLSEYHARLKALKASASYQAIIDQAHRRLSSLPSDAARYRDLSAELRLGVLQTFRRHVRSAGGLRRWLEVHIGTLRLRELMSWLGTHDTQVERQLHEGETLWEEAHRPLPAVGAPLCDARVP